MNRYLEKIAEKKYTKNKEHAKTTAAGAVAGAYGAGVNAVVKLAPKANAREANLKRGPTTNGIPDRYIRRAKLKMKGGKTGPKAAMNQAIGEIESKYAKAGNRSLLKKTGRGAVIGALVGAGMGAATAKGSAKTKNRGYEDKLLKRKSKVDGKIKYTEDKMKRQGMSLSKKAEYFKVDPASSVDTVRASLVSGGIGLGALAGHALSSTKSKSNALMYTGATLGGYAGNLLGKHKGAEYAADVNEVNKALLSLSKSELKKKSKEIMELMREQEMLKG